MTKATRQLRVLMVAPQFPPYRGGVETHVYEVGRRLAARDDVAIEVLTTDRSGALPRDETVAGMEVHRTPAVRGTGDLYLAPEIAAHVARTTADVVHVQGYHTLVPVLAMLAARRRRLRYVLTFHSGGHSSRLRHALRPVQVRLMRPLLRSAAGLVAVSRFEADLFVRGYGLAHGLVRTIPNGADLASGSDPGPIPRDPGLVLSVGRLERYKGHGRVIEAFRLVRSVLPDARLEVVGSGPEEGRLRQLAEELGMADAVRVGGVERDKVPALLRRARVVVLLSEYESHGLAVHEALALGARVVLTDSSALAEVGHLPQVAAVPPSATGDEVAAAILDQLAAPEVDPDAVPALPTWDACADSLLGLYRDVAARRRSARV
jgi:glycosyltransferase involved in cell wall biosynthesis